MVPTTNNHPRRNGEAYTKVVPSHHHPRRIVLANRPEVAFRRRNVSPELVYMGGPLIENVHVVTVYWGNTWHDPLTTPYVKKLNAFFSYIVTSPLIDQLSEYNMNGYIIGHGTHANNDSYLITDSDPAPTITLAPLSKWVVAHRVRPSVAITITSAERSFMRLRPFLTVLAV